MAFLIVFALAFVLALMLHELFEVPLRNYFSTVASITHSVIGLMGDSRKPRDK